MAIAIKSHIEFRKFFNEFFPTVYNLLKKYTEEPEVAKDLAQEAFVKVYECKEEFETLENAKAFLYTVARHIYFNHYKHVKVLEKSRSLLEYPEEENENFLQEVISQETIRVLYQAIDKLAPQSRNIILLNLQGKNNNEVAEELHISVNTVKSLKKNAYLILRKLMGKEYLWIVALLSEISAQ